MTFDIDSAIASRDQTFTPEPVQQPRAEALRRMGLFGAKREEAAKPAQPPIDNPSEGQQ